MSTDQDLSAPTSAAASARPVVDRAAALAEGAPRVPRRAVVIGVLIAAALALGGTLAERAASNAGINPVATTVPSSPSVTLPHDSGAGNLAAPMAAFLGLVGLHGRAAPDFSLTDQAGRSVTLAALRGKVVVLSFFDANCADACAVVAAEIARADTDLGAARAHVAFVTVNADPLATASRPLPAAVTSTGLARLANWKFLTGPLPALNAVWRNYGVAISVYPTTGVVTHNNVLYLVDPSGRLAYRAVAVADESRSGRFSLPPGAVRRTASGLALYARALVGASR